MFLACHKNNHGRRRVSYFRVTLRSLTLILWWSVGGLGGACRSQYKEGRRKSTLSSRLYHDKTQHIQILVRCLPTKCDTYGKTINSTSTSHHRPTRRRKYSCVFNSSLPSRFHSQYGTATSSMPSINGTCLLFKIVLASGHLPFPMK